MKKPADHQIFSVAGYINHDAAEPSMIAGYAIAADPDQALALYEAKYPDFMPVSLGSLDQLRMSVEILEAVQTGRITDNVLRQTDI